MPTAPQVTDPSHDPSNDQPRTQPVAPFNPIDHLLATAAGALTLDQNPSHLPTQLPPQFGEGRGGVDHYLITDIGNAQRLHALVKDHLIYVPAVDQWYLWTGSHWRPD